MEHGFAGAREPLSIEAGRRIELRPVSPGQAAALYALIDRNRGRLREWLPWVEWSYSLTDLTAFLKDRQHDNAAGDSLTTTIWFEHAMCGAITLHAINRRDRSSSIGYWLDVDHEGRGIMTQACRAMVNEAFRRYGLHRIEIRCATGNSRSGRIPQRLGFAEEGILREAEWLYDHWVDLRVFSMLDTVGNSPGTGCLIHLAQLPGMPMSEQVPADTQVELHRLRQLTARIGSDPLLTQASTGNCSTKLDDVLWIKASGKWMADAMRDDILIPLDLTGGVMQCLSQGIDPAERYPNASLETAVHAALPHRVVLHVHSVNTIAWAVREDGPRQLQTRLAGLRWQWIPYTASGLPLSRKIEGARRPFPDTDLFVLGNHGLVVGGEETANVEELLMEVERRLAIVPRLANPADHQSLQAICERDSQWVLPDDAGVHSLGTDPVSRAIIAGGLLYPCQAIFSDSGAAQLFRPVPFPAEGEDWRTFLIVEGCGVIVKKSAGRAEIAMLSGLAQVVQRLSAGAPLRYLTEAEVASISGEATDRYRGLAS